MRRAEWLDSFRLIEFRVDALAWACHIEVDSVLRPRVALTATLHQSHGQGALSISNVFVACCEGEM